LVNIKINKQKKFFRISYIFTPRVFPTDLVIYPQDISCSGFQDYTI